MRWKDASYSKTVSSYFSDDAHKQHYFQTIVISFHFPKSNKVREIMVNIAKGTMEFRISKKIAPVQRSAQNLTKL